MGLVIQTGDNTVLSAHSHLSVDVGSDCHPQWTYREALINGGYPHDNAPTGNSVLRPGYCKPRHCCCYTDCHFVGGLVSSSSRLTVTAIVDQRQRVGCVARSRRTSMCPDC